MQDSEPPALDGRGRRRLAAAFITALGAVALALYVGTPSLIGNYDAQAPYFESPGFFPRMALAIVCACALVQVVRVLRGAALEAGEDIDDPGANPRLVLISMGLFAG